MTIMGLSIETWFQLYTTGFILLLFCLVVMTLTLYSISIKINEIMKDVISISETENNPEE